MANLPLVFAELMVGAILLKHGVADVRAELSGKASDSTGSGSGSGGAPSNIAATSPAAITKIVTALAHAQGWGQDQINAWLGIIRNESGFDPNATNHQAGQHTYAYGLGQFFNPAPGNPILPEDQQMARNRQKYRDYGGNPDTVYGQLVGMMNYIKQNWGDPAVAFAHEQSGSY